MTENVRRELYATLQLNVFEKAHLITSNLQSQVLMGGFFMDAQCYHVDFLRAINMMTVLLDPTS